MKKIVLIMIVVIAILPCIVLAGDTDMWIKQGNQDAFIIGKVTSHIDSLYSVHVEKVLMGDMAETEIKVSEHPEWVNPHVGKYYVLSLDKNNTTYIIKYGGFEADSADYRTLKLKNATSDPGNVLGRIQNFINSGDFIDANNKAKGVNINETDSKESSTKIYGIFSGAYIIWIPVTFVICLFVAFIIVKITKLKRVSPNNLE